jgi:mono/diheme cytochrome c family protein
MGFLNLHGHFQEERDMSQTTSLFSSSRLKLAAAAAALSVFAIVGCNDDGGGNPTPPLTPVEQFLAEGKAIFEQSCTACHGHHGEGESAPPLLHSDYVIAERMRPARILLLGLPNPIDTNPIVVNGIEHNNAMPALGVEWSDHDLAAVTSYLRAGLNDSTSINCEVGENEDGQPISLCDIVASPEDATTLITEAEIKALRDSLDAKGYFDL